MKNIIISILGLCLLAACAGPTILPSEKATHVHLVKQPSEKEIASWEKVKELKCELGTNGRTFATNKEACLNSLRNQAADLGANVVVEEPTKPGYHSIWGGSCGHCVEQNGIAYKANFKDELPLQSAPVVDATAVAPSALSESPQAPAVSAPTSPSGSPSGPSKNAASAPKKQLPKGKEKLSKARSLDKGQLTKEDGLEKSPGAQPQTKVGH